MKQRSPYKKVTLSDVAREANVSSSTVSRVLNNPEIVDANTRKNILSVMSRLDYVYSKGSSSPSQAQNQDPSGRKIPKKGIIALMIPSDENPFYQTMISLVERTLTKAGYLMLLCIFNNDPENIDAYLQNLFSQQVDGCIMAFIKPDVHSAMYKKFTSLIPCVSFQSETDHVDSVSADEETGTYEMLDRLVNFGHKKIGFVGYFSNLLSYERRFGAYKRIHADHDLPIRSEYISEYKGQTGLDFQTSYREGCRLLSLPDRPTAIFCFNLKVAIGVYTAIRDYKLRIPEDISICAFDELQIAQVFSPPLSVVGMPLQGMVSSAFDFLRDRIENTSVAEADPQSEVTENAQHILFPTTVHQRASIGPAPDLQP